MIKSSGLIVVDTIVYTGRCRLRGVSFSETTAKTPTLTVYDGLTAAVGATKVVAYAVAAMVTTVSATNYVIKFSAEDNLICDTGLFADFSVDTNDGKAIIYYEIL